MTLAERKSRNIKIYMIIVIALAAFNKAYGKYEVCKDETLKQCETVSKGRAIEALIKDKKAVVIRIEKQVVDMERGTIKNEPKN